MAIIEWMVGAIIFVLTSGLIGRERFKNNPLLMGIVVVATCAASIGSIVLLKDWINSRVDERVGTAREDTTRVSNRPTQRGTLHARVEHYVALAEVAVRKAETEALGARKQLEACIDAGRRADESARLARSGIEGHGIVDLSGKQGDWPRKYYGELTGASTPNGYGVYESINSYTGAIIRRFSGVWADGKVNGKGVMSWPDRTPSMVGAWKDDEWTMTVEGKVYYDNESAFTGTREGVFGHGLFVLSSRRQSETSVVRRVGQFCWAPERCLGAELMKDGSRYVGEFVGEERNIGAVFNTAGHVVEQGYWKKGKLFVSLAP